MMLILEFKPVYKGDLPELTNGYDWCFSWQLRWNIQYWSIGRIITFELTSNGDLEMTDGCHQLPRQVIKALYVANGVEL
jgi:hypothetical protein